MLQHWKLTWWKQILKTFWLLINLIGTDQFLITDCCVKNKWKLESIASSVIAASTLPGTQLPTAYWTSSKPVLHAFFLLYHFTTLFKAHINLSPHPQEAHTLYVQSLLMVCSQLIKPKLPLMFDDVGRKLNTYRTAWINCKKLICK